MDLSFHQMFRQCSGQTVHQTQQGDSQGQFKVVQYLSEKKRIVGPTLKMYLIGNTQRNYVSNFKPIVLI